ncbi:MAG: tRNA dihydrouridine synthase DusB [Deltaproteobacteria bacterium]|nr:tRNA dihydrouridine synthase DusB [Deltaproteobacteria bacterium]
MQHIQIANVAVPSGALLAPMEAVTDLPFRTVCEELGATITFTEFLSAEALTRGAQKAIGRMWPSLQGRKFVVQIFGREPERLARAAEMGVASGATVIDINMGCPAKKVTAGLCGSALMREPELAANLVAAVRAAIPQNVPVTVKHRLGWDDQSINAPEFAMRMVDAGAAMITVHGRTRSQGFSGTANLDGIAAVRDKLPASIPVIGNGDVKTLQDYQRMRTQTGCNAVMIGRGAMGNPWLFEEIRAYENGEPHPLPPTISERHRVWRRHAELVGQYANERMHPHELRKTLAWYSRGLQGGADLRQMVFKEKSPARLLAIGETFFARQIEHAENTRPADPVAKSIARNTRRLGDRVEAPEPGAT